MTKAEKNLVRQTDGMSSKEIASWFESLSTEDKELLQHAFIRLSNKEKRTVPKFLYIPPFVPGKPLWIPDLNWYDKNME